jgi:hypothetical protein
MPYELTLEVVERAAGAGAGAAGELRVLKVLRQVSRELNHLATDVMVATYVRHLEALVEQLRRQVEQAWSLPTVGEERAAQLSGVVEQVSSAGDELRFLRAKLDDKRSARATIFRMEGIDPATRWHLLKACSLESELLGLKGVATTIKKSREQLEERPARGLGMYPDEFDPLRIGPPRRAPPPYSGEVPPFFGEPDPDHMRVPGWERDRNPPGMPGYPGGDPFSPFGPGADPFGRPPRGGGGGPFGGGPNPFDPHPRGPRGPRFI